MTDITFKAWPKTPRLFRDMILTEKIDGTNAAIQISEATSLDVPDKAIAVNVGGTVFVVAAQSRNRIVTPENDNYRFARWVWDNAHDLVYILGPGTHFGEWWGAGIQRRYGMQSKRFSLFNTSRWYETGPDGLDSMSTRACTSLLAGQIDAVPVLYEGPFHEARIWDAVDKLREGGSVAAPGFMNPEGICLFHVAAGRVFKVTSDHKDGWAENWTSPANDIPRYDAGKWEK
ncbi:RNA ligase family protein [Streptomyces sp. NPDC055036]